MGLARPDRLWDRDHLREHPARGVDLLDRRARDLRRVHAVRLPASATDAGHSRRAAARRLDLPRRPERLPAVPQSVQPKLGGRMSTSETSTQQAAKRRSQGMSGTLSIGRYGGVELRLNWSLLAVIALIVWSLAEGVFPDTNPGLSHAPSVATAR